MAKLETVLLQNLFFGRLKMPPRPKWVEAWSKHGQPRALEVNRDGGRLAALRVSTRALEPHGVVVFAHPTSRKGKHFFAEGGRAEAYLDRGYDVVAFDFNGFGESDRIDMHYWKDAATVVQHLEREGRMRVVLHGVSFGAFHIVRASSHLPANGGLVLENVSRSLFDYWKRWPSTRWAVRVMNALRFQAAVDMDIMSFLDESSRADINTLLIACEHDKYTPAEEMRDLYGHVHGPKSFLMVQGAEHLEAPERAPEQYQRALDFVAPGGG
jgi:pimeloyl-ACP methyl ester carboxylesterase